MSLRTALPRTVLAIVCLASLTACGLKGPLYLPEPSPGETPQRTPLATPVPAPASDARPEPVLTPRSDAPQATSPFGDDPAPQAQQAPGSRTGLQSSTSLEPQRQGDR